MANPRNGLARHRHHPHQRRGRGNDHDEVASQRLGHHPAEIGVGGILFARGEVIALRPVRLGLSARRKASSALGGENEQFGQIVGMDQRESPPIEARHHVDAESRDRAEQGQAHAVGFAQDDRRANDRDGHAVGKRFGRPLSRPFAVAVVRDGQRSIGFGFRLAVGGGARRGKRGDRNQHGRGGLAGAHLRDVCHAALIDVIEVPRAQCLRASGDVVNDCLARHGRQKAFAVGHVAVDQLGAGLAERIDARTSAHETSNPVTPRGQRRNEVRSNESTGAGNQDFGHGTETKIIRLAPASSPGRAPRGRGGKTFSLRCHSKDQKNQWGPLCKRAC